MSSAAASGSRSAIRALVCTCVVLVAAPSVRAQTAPVERSFQASKAVVESKLRGLGAYAGEDCPSSKVSRFLRKVRWIATSAATTSIQFSSTPPLQGTRRFA